MCDICERSIDSNAYAPLAFFFCWNRIYLQTVQNKQWFGSLFQREQYTDVDAVTAATPMADGTSAVKLMADIIYNEVGGDIAPILPFNTHAGSRDGGTYKTIQEPDMVAYAPQNNLQFHTIDKGP